MLKTSMFKRSSGLLVVMLAAVAWQAQAQAQTVPINSTADEDTIVITAERREGTLVNTPISIAAFTANQLSSAGVTNVLEMVNLVPSLRLDQLGSNTQPTIRGITTATAGVGTSANVAIYLDGFYLPSQSGSDLDLPDITNIQVLKGPQGTLFGRNATGGAIVINTKVPSQDTSGAISVGYGTYDEKLANAYVSGGLSETLSASLLGYYRDSDGWTKNIVTGNRDSHFKNYLVKGKLLFEPSPTTSFLLDVKHSWINDPFGQVYRVIGPNSTAFFIPGTRLTTQKYRSSNLEPRNRTLSNSVYLTSKVDLGGVTLTSYTGFLREKNWQRVDYDGSSAVITQSRFEQNASTFTEELSLSGKSGRLDWSAGLYYFYDNGLLPYRYNNGEVFSATPVSAVRTRIKTNAYAAFADATYNAASSLFLTLGARYSIERKDIDYKLGAAAPGSADDVWKSFTPRAVIRYELAPSSNAYASYSRGFKSGTYNAFSPSANPVKPEYVDAYEVGFKSNGQGLSLETSAFYYNYKDLQVTSYNLQGAVSVVTLQNAARAEIYGTEASLRYRVSSDFNIRLSGAYTHGEYKKFPGAVALTPLAAGGYANVLVDASGKTMLRTPKLTGNLGADYTIPVAGGELTLGGNLFATSRIFYNSANQYSQKGYVVLDLSASWTSADGDWTLALVGKNVTDAYYINYINPIGAAILANDGRPATARLTVTRRF
jgi:iron complex outermembrane recepter protein